MWLAMSHLVTYRGLKKNRDTETDLFARQQKSEGNAVSLKAHPLYILRLGYKSKFKKGEG